MEAARTTNSRNTAATAADGALADYFAAYDKLMSRWTVPVETADVPSAFGPTRVNICGPADAPPLVLLHGGRTNSAYWFATAGELARTRRVYALDTIGDPGRSRNDGRPLRTREDLMVWLTAVLDGLGIERAGFCGHSFGSWICLVYALRGPQGRVRRLALLDPTQCFAGFAPACLWRALPGLLRPGKSAEPYLAWEAGGVPYDPDWLAMQRLGARFPVGKVISGRRPTPEALQALRIPVLVLLAERSRVHDIRKVGEAARRSLPAVTVDTLPGVSHHLIPFTRPEQLNRRLADFFEAESSKGTESSKGAESSKGTAGS
jgi:pimeloyl-ACP methyl ester carboxylesterase